MRLWGRDRESVKVKKIAAARAVYESADYQEVEIKFKSEDGEILILRVPARLIPSLIQDLSMTYNAINPPLQSGSYQSQWQGME